MSTGQSSGGNSSAGIPSSQVCIGLCQIARTNYDSMMNCASRIQNKPFLLYSSSFRNYYRDETSNQGRCSDV